MTNALLIRAMEVDDEARRLADELRPYFGGDIWFMLDRYSDEGGPAISISGNEVHVGRRYLSENGLPYFRKIGWQCGDFMYYAAADALPQYDRYWLIEPDVHFTNDVVDFFGRMDAIDVDLLGAQFSPRQPAWGWHKTLTPFTDGPIHGLAFPLSRLSRRAALHLKAVRAEYSATDYAKNQTYALGKPLLYANDEVFVGTILMRDGFACESLNRVARDEMSGYFHPVFPVLPAEIPLLSGKIAHPVCDPKKAAKKFAVLMLNPRWHGTRLHGRMEEITAKLGAEAWLEYSQIPPDDLRAIVAELAQQKEHS